MTRRRTTDARALRVVLVCDEPHWAIGTMAASIREYASDEVLEIDIVAESDFKVFGKAARCVSRADVVHWLSTTTWTRYGPALLAPRSLVSVHHVDGTEPWKCDLRRPGWTITHSSDGVRQIRETCGWSPSHTLPYGFDPTWFSFVDVEEKLRARAGLGVPASAYVIGTFANASFGRKGIQLLAAALDLLPKNVDVQLVLTGRGWIPHLPRLSAVVTKLHHLPVESNRQLRERYAALDLYLCTSSLEGGPLPVLEALACAVPVVSTAVGHVPELVAAGEWNGTVATASPESISAAMMSRIASSQPCVSDRRIACSVEAWSWRALADQYRSRYRAAASVVGPHRETALVGFAACNAAIIRREFLDQKKAVKRRVFDLVNRRRN